MICERAQCVSDKYAAWTLTGLSYKALLVYEREMCRSMDADIRFQAVLHDKQLKNDNGSKPVSKDEARRLAEDPLLHFPDDVDYSTFTHEYISPKVSAAMTYLEKRGEGYEMNMDELENLWTPERAAAIEGEDLVAKRAAVNGKLWALYKHMSKHCKVTLPLLRQVVAKDMALGMLMPDMQEAAEYNKGKSPEEAFNISRNIVEIPAEHITKLADKDALLPLLLEVARKGGLHALNGVIHG